MFVDNEAFVEGIKFQHVQLESKHFIFVHLYQEYEDDLDADLLRSEAILARQVYPDFDLDCELVVFWNDAVNETCMGAEINPHRK